MTAHDDGQFETLGESASSESLETGSAAVSQINLPQKTVPKFNDPEAASGNQSVRDMAFLAPNPGEGTYIGPYVNGKPHGRGRFRWKNGVTYEGDFVYGVIEGMGKKIYRTDIYEGEFRDNMRSGKGKYYWSNGSIYIGDWQNDVKQGIGRMTNSAGDVFEGSWYANRPNGIGKCMYRKGDVYEGEWKDGAITGQGVKKWANGSVYSGQWVDGKMHGKGTFTNFAGEIWEGTFDNNIRKDGRWIRKKNIFGKLKDC